MSELQTWLNWDQNLPRAADGRKRSVPPLPLPSYRTTVLNKLTAKTDV